MRKLEIAQAEQLLDVLGDNGHRSTNPRREVVYAIVSQQRHFTAEQLRHQLPWVGRATIYRSLKLLVEAGVLCRVLLDVGKLHYQLSHKDHHHHLLCVECGTSEDLLGCNIDDLLRQVSATHGFQLSGHRLEVYGRCHNCLDKLMISD